MNPSWRSRSRPLRAAALGLGAALALSACGDADDGDTITFIAAEYSSDTEPYWQELIADFEEANPGMSVDLQVVNWDDIDQHVTTLVQNRQQPDVLNLNKFAGFAADGLLRPAEDVVSAEVRDDFLPGFADNSVYEGTQYGLPFIASTRLFFYNTDLFDEAGLDGPPRTWDEVADYAEQISELGAVGYGLPLGPEEAQAEFQMWINGNGGHWTDSDGNWAINSEENVETLEFLAGMVDDGLTQPNPATTNRADMFNAFAQGDVGMLNGAVFLPGVIEDQNPDLNYDIAPIPGNEGHEPSTLGVQDYLMAFDNPGNEEAVNAFLDFVYDTDNYTEFLSTERFLPATDSASEAMTSDAELAPFIEALPEARFFPTTRPEWTEVDGAVKQEIGTAVQDAEPREVLDRLQQRASGE
ncbi:extracellular solute-binding protein [Haloechinothrix sp. YIM 98757]|uniref:Extracellular solute-binding protein n=1 Tax=Haloechinothrix aidingensis TaxID=2752311 RepID=A0A838AAD6_9PSEU|nr:extracellular solute-binding protein [Haloechinothrix aidingensis]MBA0126193.1 extracellular solute-binding protein [Haloechinothrix aidingensis]